MNKIGVIGFGTMGSGIVTQALICGFKVKVQDIKDDYITKGKASVESNISRLLRRNEITGTSEEFFKNLETTTDLSSLKDCDLVIEAATENKAIKLELFKKLDELMPANVILASNTSSISITEIAATTKRPEKVIGMHFMNPVPVMKLIEIIKGISTSDETLTQIVELSKKLNKTPVEVNDFPGFVLNRILIPMINEACFTLMEGVAKAEEIDNCMKLGANQPIGPLALADMIGIDVCLAIMEVLFDGFKDTKYRPCPLMVKMVKAGHLGRKTKKGFYNY